MNELEMARIETIMELSDAFIKTTSDIATTYGDDPELAAILAAAYTMSIKRIEIVCPGFSNYVCTLLEDEE